MKKVKLVVLLVIVLTALFTICTVSADYNIYVNLLSTYPNSASYFSQMKKLTSRNFYDDGTYRDYIREFVRNDSEKTITVYCNGAIESILYLDDANMVSGYRSVPSVDYPTHYVSYSDEVIVYEGGQNGDVFHIKKDGGCTLNGSDQYYYIKPDREYQYDNLGRIVYSKGAGIESWIEYYTDTDTEPPVITAFYCNTNTTVNRNETETITFTATATDNVGVAELAVIVDGVPVKTVYNTDSISAAIQTSGLRLGNNEIYAYAKDAAGNEVYSHSIVITVTESNPQSDIKVFVNGTQVQFDVQPQIINSRAMVPLRAILEALGATVEWNQAEQRILATKWYVPTQGYISAEFVIGRNYMRNSFGNGYYELDSPPIITDGRTLIPARAAAEAFNYNVEWDGETRTVYIFE